MMSAMSNQTPALPPWLHPTAQVATGLVFTDTARRVLLVKPTYRDVWHLPGGVVENGESPAGAAVREVREELGLEAEARRMLGVDYRPPTPGCRGNAHRFLFDGGALTADQLDQIVMPADEVRDWRFVELDDLDDYVIPVLASRIRHMLNGQTYLEEGEPVR